MMLQTDETLQQADYIFLIIGLNALENMSTPYEVIIISYRHYM
jgi:hypothetical protein